MLNDLIALLIEVTSVGVSGRQLKKPLEVPRPKRDGGARANRPRTTEETDRAFKQGVSVLAATSRAVTG